MIKKYLVLFCALFVFVLSVPMSVSAAYLSPSQYGVILETHYTNMGRYSRYALYPDPVSDRFPFSPGCVIYVWPEENTQWGNNSVPTYGALILDPAQSSRAGNRNVSALRSYAEANGSFDGYEFNNYFGIWSYNSDDLLEEANDDYYGESSFRFTSLYYPSFTASDYVKHFDSRKQMEEYVLGMIPENAEPSSDPHNFNDDTYDVGFQPPALSKLTYNGFNIDNPEGYDFDLIVEYKMHDSKMVRESYDMTHTYNIAKSDTSTVVASGYYDFKTSAISPNTDGRFNIFEFYKFDIMDKYRQAWIANTNKYNSSYKNLPGYSALTMTLNPPKEPQSGYQFYKSSYENSKPDMHDQILNSLDINVSDFEVWMRASQKFTVSYTVRFLDVAQGKYSQWVKYTLTFDGRTIPIQVNTDQLPPGAINPNIQIEPIIGANPDGSPIMDPNGTTLIPDPVTDTYIEDPPILDLGDNGSIDVSDVTNIFNQLQSLVGQGPALFAKLFSFIPQWLQLLIWASVAIACLLSLYHFIRG